MWITSKEFREKYHITPQHLYQLKKTNKIKTKPYLGKSYLIEDGEDDRVVVIYARVSTSKQKKDLDNQIDYLRKYCVSNGESPSHVFSDIGSGMNDNRKSMSEMIDMVIKGKVKKIVISHKDRLTRFGFGYIETICNKFGTVIEIVNLEDEKSFQDELTEDLIAIVHHFSMKFYGKRKNSCQDIERNLKDFKNLEDK